jgi:DNA-binding transcriptional LysR family regulator
MTVQARIGDLEIGLLRMFVAVVECGSMGRAAAAVEMTQPAVSQQMLRLERIVGQKLFARGRNGIALTSDGRLLVKYAGRVLDLNNEILLRFRRDRSQSLVALGVSGGIAMAGLSSSLRRFQNLQPHSELRVLTAPPNKIEALLTSGDLHLGVAEPSAMRRNPLAKWPVQLAWAAPRRFRLEHFGAVPLVLFEGPCPWQDSLLESLRDADREWHVAFESTSMDAILAATQSGLGIAALPTEFVRNSRLVPFIHPALPAAPKVEFGLFGACALPNSARTLLEAVQSCASATN